MTWQHNLANKMLEKTLIPMMSQEKILGVKNVLTYKEQQKFINFSEKFMLFTLTIATYITYFIVGKYFLNKVGTTQTALIFGVIIIAKITNLTEAITNAND